MRKHFLAFFLVAAIPVLAATASAQVLKGSQPVDAKPKGTQKTSKANEHSASTRSTAGKKAPSIRALADGSSKDPAYRSTRTAPHPDALTVKQTNRVGARASGGTIKPEMGDGSVRAKTGTADIVATSGALNTNHGSTLKETAKTAPTRAESQKAKKTVKQTTQPN